MQRRRSRHVVRRHSRLGEALERLWEGLKNGIDNSQYKLEALLDLLVARGAHVDGGESMYMNEQLLDVPSVRAVPICEAL